VVDDISRNANSFVWRLHIRDAQLSHQQRHSTSLFALTTV
jgi:hypothetical protein